MAWCPAKEKGRNVNMYGRDLGHGGSRCTASSRGFDFACSVLQVPVDEINTPIALEELPRAYHESGYPAKFVPFVLEEARACLAQGNGERLSPFPVSFPNPF